MNSAEIEKLFLTKSGSSISSKQTLKTLSVWTYLLELKSKFRMHSPVNIEFEVLLYDLKNLVENIVK